MKYGILGDIHANLSALQTALDQMDRAQVDAVLSVGDVVGYGAAPKECIDLLREVGAIVVKGNHDAACTGELDDRHFNAYARAAVKWTRDNLSLEEIHWLVELPMTATLEHCQVSHGTLYRPELFDYIMSTTDADPSLDIMERPVCFVGHSHVPITLMRLREEPDRTAYTLDADIDVGEARASLVNVGSVGQPRDEDPRTAYAIYDTDAARVQVLRSEYDIELEAHRIRDAGLPTVLADRLFLGV